MKEIAIIETLIIGIYLGMRLVKYILKGKEKK